METATNIPSIRRRRAALLALRSGLARELLLAEGWVQATVADSIGVDESTVSRWLSGARRPTGARGREFLDLVAALLGDAT